MMITLNEYLEVLPVFQTDRLRRDYSDLAMRPDYRQLGEFFFTELYGPRDYSARDEQLQRAHQFLPLIPGVSVHDVEQSLELIEITNTLDTELARQLLHIQAPLSFDEPTYEHAYRLADNYAQRVRQIELVSAILVGLHRLARLPWLGLALKHTRGAAQLARLENFHQFLLAGYHALRPTSDIRFFIDTLYERELTRLNRIYQRQPSAVDAEQQSGVLD